MEINRITLKVLIDKLMRHPMLQSITEESIIDYTIDFMRIIGLPNMFELEESDIDINNSKGEFPCEVLDIVEVTDSKCNKLHPKDKVLCSKDSNYYTIKGRYLYTDSPNTPLKVLYKTIKTDDEGFPLIPDNSSFMRALEAYIKKQYFTILFDLGQLHGQVLQNIQQEYSWAVGDCTNEFLRLSPEDMEVLLPKIKKW